MRVGRLRHRLRIQEPTQTRTGSGGFTHSWSTVAVVWAGVWPLVGREYMEARRVDADVTHEVRIRHRDGLTPSHQFVFDNDTSRVLNIVSIRNVEERGRELIVMCREDV